jgi:hypothetical protein
MNIVTVGMLMLPCITRCQSRYIVYILLIFGKLKKQHVDQIFLLILRCDKI